MSLTTARQRQQIATDAVSPAEMPETLRMPGQDRPGGRNLRTTSGRARPEQGAAPGPVLSPTASMSLAATVGA